MERKCFVCKKGLKEDEGMEKTYTTSCWVDVLVLCNKCCDSEYGSGK